MDVLISFAKNPLEEAIMKSTEQRLKSLFDFQKFNRNPRLDRLIEEAESEAVKLSDDELALVNAAGELAQIADGNATIRQAEKEARRHSGD